jgi:hypothetical protein
MQAIFLTSQRLITEHWPAAARLLAPVLEAVRGEFTVDDLEEMCREGRAVAGIAFDEAGEPFMAMVFEFHHYRRFSSVFVLALAGRDLRRLAATFWPNFLAWCAESGATHVEACALPAMTRMLQPLGFEHTYNFIRMPTGATP